MMRQTLFLTVAALALAGAALVLQETVDPAEALASSDQINPYSRTGNLSKKVQLEFGEVEQLINETE